MNQPPLNPDALEAACAGFYNDHMGLTNWQRLRSADPALADKYRAGMKAAVSAYLAAALPEVTSVEELDQLPVGSVVRGGEDDLVGEKIRFSPYLPHWCTIGEEVEADKRDLLPARVLYRPEVKP